VEDKVVNPLLHDVLRSGVNNFAEVIHFRRLEGRTPRLIHEVNAHHAALHDAEFGATFPTLTPAVDVHRLVLVAVEEDIQPEVFVKLGHVGGAENSRCLEGRSLKFYSVSTPRRARQRARDQAAAMGKPELRAFCKSWSILRRAFSTVPRRSSQSVASFMTRALPQAIPPRDLMKSSRSDGAERTRRSTAGLGLRRLVAQEVLVLVRAISLKILCSILHGITVVQFLVKFFAPQTRAQSQDVPVRRGLQVGTIKP